MNSVCILTATGALVGSTLAAAPVISTFDADEQGFVGSTIATTQIHSASGGNPGGHITLRKDLSTGFDIGTQHSTNPDYLGNYAAGGINEAGFDINVFNTTLDDVWLRVRVGPGQDGWHYAFGGLAPNGNAWVSLAVTFDPTWEDATAILNGWTQEAGAPSFADMMANVGWFEVRTINPIDESALIGLDNIYLVPAPGAAALLGLGLLTARRRR